MSDSLAAPWYERHKGLLTAVGLLGTLVGIFRADIWPRLAVAFHRVGWILWGFWSWLWATHRIPGWLLLLLGAAGFSAGRRFLKVLFAPAGFSAPVNEPTVPLTAVCDQVKWVGQITQAGTVVGELVSYCPECECQIRPECWHDVLERSWVTRFKCVDCRATDHQVLGALEDIHSIVVRRIEARWRRGEFGSMPTPPLTDLENATS